MPKSPAHSDTTLRVDIGVGGRFHADRMAFALLRRGHNAQLWTSLPATRFPHIARDRVHSFLHAEMIYRLGRAMRAEREGEWLKMRWFGAAIAQKLRGTAGDVFIGWSCFALEALKAVRHRYKVIMRDSAHIATQIELLEKEYAKLGRVFPSRHRVVERECEEYERADSILVLSEFARRTFLAHGVPARKLEVLRLGVDTSRFQPAAEKTFGRPLRLVYFGSLSVRKGIPYLLEAVRDFLPDELTLTLIGPAESVVRESLARHPQVLWLGPLPQDVLAQRLREQDIFVMPTIEDGFGQTVIQAMASGLVPVATDRCGAAEAIVPGQNGFIIPAADARALREALQQILQARDRLGQWRHAALQTARLQTWDHYGDHLARWIDRLTGLAPVLAFEAGT